MIDFLQTSKENSINLSMASLSLSRQHRERE